MSKYDYEVSKTLFGSTRDYSFASLIMGAGRVADTENLAKLEEAWPEIIAELRERYNAPGGILPGDFEEAKKYDE